MPAGAVKTRNATSGLSVEERTQIEAELENNQTSALITEDDGEIFYLLCTRKLPSLSASRRFLHLSNGTDAEQAISAVSL